MQTWKIKRDTPIWEVKFTGKLNNEIEYVTSGSDIKPSGDINVVLFIEQHTPGILHISQSQIEYAKNNYSYISDNPISKNHPIYRLLYNRKSPGQVNKNSTLIIED